MLQFPKLLAAGLLGIALAAGLMIPVAPAQAAPTKSSDQLWREVEVFQYLHALDFTADQAQRAAELVEPVHALAAQIEARGEGEEVLAAIAEIRVAALAGQPITEAMYKKVTTAKAKAAAEWTDKATPTVWAAAAEAASKVIPSLTHDQTLAAARYGVRAQAEATVTGALGQADADAEAWTQWLDDTLSELSATNPISDETTVAVTAFLNKLHAMGAVDADALTAPQAAEFAQLLATAGTDEDLAALATSGLADVIVANSELAACLREYAAAAR